MLASSALEGLNGAALNVLTAWLLVCGGVLSGAMSGLFFRREDWLGGYGAYRRRLVRLGHISFFGLAILNIMFALSVPWLDPESRAFSISSMMFVAGGVSMPLACFLNAWRSSLHLLFAVPVTVMGLGAGLTVYGVLAPHL